MTVLRFGKTGHWWYGKSAVCPACEAIVRFDIGDVPDAVTSDNKNVQVSFKCPVCSDYISMTTKHNRKL